MLENIEGALIPSLHNEPLDLRVVIDTIAKISEIPYPWIGMLFYVKETKKIYSATEISSDNKITGYIEFHASGNISKIIYIMIINVLILYRFRNFVNKRAFRVS